MLGLSCERMDENVAAYVGNSAFHRGFCRWYMHWIYFPFFDHHIAVSEHAASELVAASRRHRVRRGIWIRPMGVDVTRFSPDRRSAGDAAASAAEVQWWPRHSLAALRRPPGSGEESALAD